MWVWKTSDRVTAGIPDALLLEDGTPIFVEFKRRTKGQCIEELVQEVQKATLRKLIKSGADAIVVAFSDEGEEVYFGDTLQRAPWPSLLAYLDERLR